MKFKDGVLRTEVVEEVGTHIDCVGLPIYENERISIMSYSEDWEIFAFTVATQ